MALMSHRDTGAADADADGTVRLAAPSARTVVRVIAIVAACAVLLYLAWRMRDVLRLVVISVFLALALLPVVDAIDARVRVPRAAIILSIYARALPSQLREATGPLQDVTVKAFGAIGQFVTVLSVAFLLMLNGRRYVGMGLRLTGSRETRYRKLVIDINQAVGRYMLGNIAISVLATLATWLVLTIGAIVVALATLTVDFPTATIVWVAFVIVYQRFENYVVQPLVYGRALNVNPLVTILGVLAGASLLGVLGALLAIPVAAAVQIILRDWWANRSAAPEAA